VLRYWNSDVLTNVDAVLADILSKITTTPTPNPSPQGGGE
jgi:very-short-patch-repair endonuclease